MATSEMRSVACPGGEYRKHESAYVDEGAVIGAGTRIWHFSHIMPGATIGKRCSIGQNVNVDGGVTIGNNVKIGANAVIHKDIPDNAIVVLDPGFKIISFKGNDPDDV